ncbi:response regulator [Bacillus fonticola]|uniref:response regulator n=1 Tax=Bacillus fonticola TaxID=2728853 RepID=UPI0014740F60|nr:response regulator [Bacillus fonticola]
MATVLIVDDATFMRMTLKEIVEQNGHRVVGEAENGQDAITHYRILQPDLVLMDITMPVLNGLEAMHQIIEEDPSAKVIMCTALGQKKVVMQCIEAGAKDFVTKPFERHRILDAIERVLS